MRFEAIEEAKKAARLGNLPPENEMHPNDSHPQLRAQNLETEGIRRGGALFNVFKGAAFRGFEPAHMPDFGKAHMAQILGFDSQHFIAVSDAPWDRVPTH